MQIGVVMMIIFAVKKPLIQRLFKKTSNNLIND